MVPKIVKTSKIPQDDLTPWPIDTLFGKMKSRKIPPLPRPPRRLVAEYKDLVNRKGRCRLATILLDR